MPALASAVFWGAAIIVLDLGSKTSVTGTLFTSQMPQVILSLGFILWALRRNLSGIRLGSATVLVGSGVFLALGNFAFYTAANEGNIGIVSILSALSPLVTALLAVLLFKERLSRAETAALVIVVIGASCVVA